MIKFCVYESCDKGKTLKPAKYPECKVDPSWNKNEYDTLEDSCEYADKWLGSFSPTKDRLIYEFNLTGKVFYNISGYGDIIVIQKEEIF